LNVYEPVKRPTDGEVKIFAYKAWRLVRHHNPVGEKLFTTPSNFFGGLHRSDLLHGKI